MWFWLSLASALLGAVDIILNKKALKNVSPVVLNWALNALPIPILIIIILKSGIPALNITFWIAVTGSSITWSIGKSMINHGLKNSLVSQIIPLTSFTGIFTYIFGLVFLGENLKLIPMLGLVSIILGSYILNVDQAREGILKPFKLIFASKASILFLLALMITSITAIFDKKSLLNTIPTSVLFVLLVENIIETLILTPYLIIKEKNTWILEVRNNFKVLFINSMLLLLIGYVVFAAYSDSPVALVLGIKRLQIFFALILGYFFLKDKPTKHAWIATLIMILGTILIKIG